MNLKKESFLIFETGGSTPLTIINKCVLINELYISIEINTTNHFF